MFLNKSFMISYLQVPFGQIGITACGTTKLKHIVCILWVYNLIDIRREILTVMLMVKRQNLARVEQN